MDNILQNITAAILAHSWLQVVAVITAVLYLVLAIRGKQMVLVFWFYQHGYLYLSFL